MYANLPYACKELINLYALNQIKDYEPLQEFNKICDYKPCSYSCIKLKNADKIYKRVRRDQNTEAKKKIIKLCKEYERLMYTRLENYVPTNKNHSSYRICPMKPYLYKMYDIHLRIIMFYYLLASYLSNGMIKRGFNTNNEILSRSAYAYFYDVLIRKDDVELYIINNRIQISI